MAIARSEDALMAAPLRRLRSVLLRRHEHQVLLRCLRGLWSCRWGPLNTEPEPGARSCNKVEVLNAALLSMALSVALILLYFWSQAKNDYNDFDWNAFGGLGYWFPWSVVLLVLTSAFFTYISALMLLLVCLLSEHQPLHLHWTHKVGVVGVLLFSVVALLVLSKLWPDEWATLLLSFQITAPFLHVGGVLVMTVLSWPVAVLFCRGPGSGSVAALLSAFSGPGPGARPAADLRGSAPPGGAAEKQHCQTQPALQRRVLAARQETRGGEHQREPVRGQRAVAVLRGLVLRRPISDDQRPAAAQSHDPAPPPHDAGRVPSDVDPRGPAVPGPGAAGVRLPLVRPPHRPQPRCCPPTSPQGPNSGPGTGLILGFGRGLSARRWRERAMAPSAGTSTTLDSST